MRITVEFETKPNANTNIMQPQNINFQNVSGNLIQETKKFLISLESNAEDVIEVLRSIWELSSLYDGYFYKPCKYGIGEHVYIIENGMHIKEVIIVNIANGFYQVCFTDRKGSIKLRESRLYKTIGEAATKNSAAKTELSELRKKKTYHSPYDYECGYYG